MKIQKNIGVSTESKLTHGNFEHTSYKIEILSTDIFVEKVVSFPFDVNIIRAKYLDSDVMVGDQLSAEINPKFTIGVTTIETISTILHVSETVFNNVNVGYKIFITDGVNYEDLGRCLSKDNNNEIITEIEPVNVYALGSYIQYTIPLIESLYFMGANAERIIEGTSKANYLPANVPIVLKYINNTATAKNFIFDFEILY